MGEGGVGRQGLGFDRGVGYGEWVGWPGGPIGLPVGWDGPTPMGRGVHLFCFVFTFVFLIYFTFSVSVLFSIILLLVKYTLSI